jgi:hypothetical protein
MTARHIVRVFIGMTALVAYPASGAAAPPVRPLLATCRFAEPVLETDAAGITRVSIAECVPWSQPGEPILPFRTLRLLLPLGFTATGVTARADSPAVTVAGAWRIELGRDPVAYGTAVPAHAVASAPSVRAPYPSRLAELVSVQHMSGYALAIVRVFPLQYTAFSQQLDFTSDVTVEVALSTALDGFIAPSTRHVTYQRLVAVIDNPEALSAEAPLLPRDLGAPTGYLLVTRAALLPAFQPLLDQKTAAGLTVHTETMEAITNQFAGVDAAERLRNFIRHAYTTWDVQYVLLGGDIKAVPYRGVYATCSGATEMAMPSDLYFACLDGSWNADGDAIWGEPNDGESGGDVDLLAEVFVGRAPVESAAEVTNFVAKCLLASQTPFKACFAGEYLGAPGVQGGDALDTLWPAFDSSHCPVAWLDDRPLDAPAWTAADALAALNRAPSLVVHFGHTDEATLLRLSRSQLDLLTNPTPFLLYSTGCDAGAFDNGPWSDCIAEEFVKRHQRGAFAVLANSREGWFDNDNEVQYSGEFQNRFFQQLLSNEATPVGAAHQRAKEELLGSVETSGSNMPYRWCMFGITLFGDPQASIRVPLSLRLSVMPSARVITWNSWSNHTYSVYRATSLSAEPGICLTNNMLATPPTNTFIDSAANLDRAFYRVYTQPIP